MAGEVEQAATQATEQVSQQATQQVSQPIPEQPAVQQPEWVGVRDALKGMGYELPGTIQDDNQALAHLGAAYREAERLRALEPLAREYQQHAGEFRSWRQQQAEAQKKQSEQAKQWWKAPEYDARWESQLTRDPNTGELRAAQGAPVDVVQKYLAWQDHQRQTIQKLAQDPIGMMKPGLEPLVQEMVTKLLQEKLGGYRQEQSAMSFVQENSGWLHARDQQGNIQRDQGGQPVLSELGRRFAAYVYEAAQMQMPQEVQQKYALAGVQRDYALAMAQRQQSGTQQQGDAAKQQFLAAAQGKQPGGAVAAAAVTPAGQRSVRNKRDLEQLMMERMKQGGLMPGTSVEVG